MKESPGSGRRKLSQATETDSGGKDALSPKSLEKDVTKVEAGVSDEEPIEVKCIGEVIKRSNKGKAERKHYGAFEVENTRYALEESVLVAPAESGQKPYVAIIKEIKQAKDGTVAVTGQWFYRPEEAEKKGGGSWTSTDSRELFYSFHRDEVPAESVMHKCVVHFIPPQKKPPIRTKHPGFIVQQVYDTVEKKLWKLTDKDYEDSKQREIDLLVQKTRDALGELPNIDGEEAAQIIDQEEAEKTRRHSRRRMVPHLSINKDDSGEIVAKSSPVEITTKADAPPSAKIDTPSSCKTPNAGFPSDIAELLHANNVLTGQTARDRWLEKITSTLKSVFDASEQSDTPMKVPETDNSTPKVDTPLDTNDVKTSEPTNGEGEQKLKKDMVDGVIVWPESAISAASALEKFAHEFHDTDHHKYNLKMRQLDFNLKRSPCLVRRVLNKELEPGIVFHMTPVELKDGLTAAEKKAREPAELQTLQMTDARCGICGEREVGVKDIIQVGYGDRYQLECLKCGHSWYASRDSVSSLTTGPADIVNASPTVGLAPWATLKFEEVEKELISPKGEAEKPPGAQEALSTLDSKKEGDETRAPVSHYQDVENSLTEHINLPAHMPSNDHSKVEDQVEKKAASETEINPTKEKVDVPAAAHTMDVVKSKEEQKAEIDSSVERTPTSITADKVASEAAKADVFAK
ncbi:hypothetical protein AXG93_2024s1140 [Marchantia polymorpha subsp. ruderalis]|uniref:BAH domain-containing protein n=1 Tax=Marchantia polymorpha subsp. ruderalis TaxID=1480154 RepID=A0A176VL20_MARPO|nr:hypothetical protein AXG93_2024s1140 [Marchantia polymorpha subsp. ruderalis]